jgi:hypothetical protein
MSPQWKCEVLKSERAVNEQALIREVFPAHTAKRLARLMSIPLETAKHWLHRSLSSYRRAEVALTLLEEFDKETRRREEIRRQLCVMAGLTHEVEILGMVGSGEVQIALADRLLASAERNAEKASSHEADARRLAEKASKHL